MTTSRLKPFAPPGDRVADGLDLADVVALERHAVLVLDDLRELGEVQRIDVEILERGLVGDLADSSTPNCGRPRRRSSGRSSAVQWPLGLSSFWAG
jgi:hypothetical protein